MAIDTKELRLMLAEYGTSEDDPLEVGPRTAKRICSALAGSEWGSKLQTVNGNDVIWTELQQHCICNILAAICDELAYGTQVETEFASRLRRLLDGLQAYYGADMEIERCRDKVDAALG